MKNTTYFKLIYTIIFYFSITLSFGQVENTNPAEHPCGTVLSVDSNSEYQNKSNLNWKNQRQTYINEVANFRKSASKLTSNIRFVPIQLHIIRTTAGTGGISVADLEIALEVANNYYSEGGIYLYQCSTINYIDDDNYYDYDKSEMTALHTAHGVANVLNIYIANSVTSSGTSICGHAQFPGGLDFAILPEICAMNGSTFAHEVGHYFNAYHTHETYLGAELVDGSNCSSKGDVVCDTPADPSLSGKVDIYNCVYTGTNTDGNGQTYTPPVSNIMSYSAKGCRVVFTDEQYARMLASIDNDRSYLNCPTSTLETNFRSFPDLNNCTNSLDVEFSNLTTGNATSWSWDFGDGNTATTQTPTHTYTTPGSYSVSLSANNVGGTDVETKNYEIAVGAVSIPYLEDFENGASDLGRFKKTSTMKNYVALNAAAGNGSTNGLAFYGFGVGPTTSSPYFYIPSSTTAFKNLVNPYFKSEVSLCVDATNFSTLSLGFDLKQLHKYNSNYSNFRITINGTEVAIYQSDGTETWSTKSVNLTAYAGSVITIGFEGSHKYGIGDNATFIDNIAITGTPISTSWTGVTDTNWDTTTNWSDGVPAATTNVIIPSGLTNYPTASTAVTVNSVTMNSSSSLIAQSTFSGNIIYNRNIPTTNWYMVSSPVIGQTIVDFYTNESPVIGSGVGEARKVAIAPYDNSVAQSWSYYTLGQVDGIGTNDTSDLFNSGTGYTVKMQAIGDISFTGTLDVNDAGVGVGITSNLNAYNLIGNPYPSYLAANNASDAINILKVNDTDNDFLTEATIWIWDQATNTYDQFNHASPSFHIAPAQSFFVKSNGSNTFSFTEAMQKHVNTDTFQKTEITRPEIKLTLTDGTLTRDTDIFYIEGTTTAFDSGYDSSIFNGAANSFEIYTHAVANGTGKNLGIQSLPTANYENMIIPIGIKAAAGSEITITASAINLPNGMNIYLEDKVENSFTKIDATSGFATTLSSELNGIGRFYLHTSNGTLNTNEFILKNLSVYTLDKNNLRIVGVQNGFSNVRIFDIIGKQVVNTSFEGQGVNDIALPNLNSGIYIVQVATESGILKKKIRI
ncbi:PKD domain-containing protein [Polaribacter sp.]|uniref:PKD domain-containing protein n=1 Tax=Polaribacter sp. TaxID=1920175 RepID=UPI003EF98842